MQLFPASLLLWIPKLPEAVRQLISQKQHQLRSSISSQILRHAVARCSQLVLVWSRMPPAATKVPSSSWEPEPWAKRTELGSTAHHGLRTSYQGSPEPVCSVVPLGSQWEKWFLHKRVCADLASAMLLHSSFLDVNYRVSRWEVNVWLGQLKNWLRCLFNRLCLCLDLQIAWNTGFEQTWTSPFTSLRCLETKSTKWSTEKTGVQYK